MKLVVDTNIVRYLAGVNEVKEFDIAKLQSIVNNGDYQPAITIFSLIEILQHLYDSDIVQQNRMKSILTYLRDNHFGLVADKNIAIDCENIFERCLKDDKQIDYIYDNITPTLITYDEAFLTNMTMSVGFVFAILLFQYDNSRKNDPALLDDFCNWLIQFMGLIKNSCSKGYHQLLEQSYAKQNTCYNPKITAEIIDNILCVFYSYYKVYTENIKPPIDIKPLIDEAKTKNVNTQNYRNLLKQGITNQHISKCTDTLYDKYVPPHDSPAIDTICKEIIKLILKNHRTKFNDFIDYLNLVMPAQLSLTDKDAIYFTNEKKWNDIIKNNIGDEYFTNCYNFYKLVME